MSGRLIQNLSQLGEGETGHTRDGRVFYCLGKGKYFDYVRGVLINKSQTFVTVQSTSRGGGGGAGGTDLTGFSGVVHVSSGTVLGNASTDEVIEGDNLYYTDARAKAAVQPGGHVYAASAVGTDAYAIVVSPAITALTVGQSFWFKADVANTGACTLQVCSLPNPAVAIKKLHDQDLATGDIEAGQIVCVSWDGTYWQMQSQRACYDPDEKAKVSSNDTTAGYLNGKLVAGANITLTEGGDGGNETLTIAGTASGGLVLYYGESTTGTDAYACNATPTLTAYANGVVLLVHVDTANSGACTLNVNSLGAKAIKTTSDLDGNWHDPNNSILANDYILVAYETTNDHFRLLNVWV